MSHPKKINLFLLVFLPFLVFGQRSGGERFAEERSRVVLRNLTKLNTRHIEFSPVFFQDGMVFVSSRQRGGYIDEESGETYFDLFFTSLEPDGSPGRVKPFSLELNSPLHEGPLTFSADEQTVFFTRNNQELTPTQSKSGRISLKIYQAEWGPYNDWINVRPLPFNSGSYSCMHPALSTDGKRLYFASDRPGGFGKRDIYMVEKRDGDWSEPINLGPQINTAGNESYPFFHESGYFFFASDGHPGEGGLDLFMIDMGGKRWGELTNLGKPFNTPDDDFGFLMHESGTRGYFSSNRQDGLGKDDIYMFYVPDGLGGVRVVKEVASEIRVWDADSRRALAGAQVYLIETDDFGDNKAGIGSGRTAEQLRGEPALQTSPRGNGRLQLNPEKSYLIKVVKEGFKDQEVRLYAGGMPPAINVKLEPFDCIPLNGSVDNAKTSGVVSDALIRIRNECTGEETTLRTGRDGSYQYCLDIGCTFIITGEKPGFISGSTSVSTEHLRGNRLFRASLTLQPDEGFRQKGSLSPGYTLVLPQVSFASGKAELLASSTPALNQLARLLTEYPGLDIELGVHTDARGSEWENQRLSLRRSETVRNFLLQQGIAPKRLRAFGYGESQLLNECTDDQPCSEEQHRENRRLEITLVRVDPALSATELRQRLQNP